VDGISRELACSEVVGLWRCFEGGTGKLERGKGVDSVEGGSSLRRKNTKNRRGWGNLPVNVLQ